MSNFISILAFISTIIFSLSQSYIIYILKRNDKEGLKITSSFSIISCLVYQWIWFIYYRKIENNNVCWCYLIGTIFSFVLSAIYLFFYSKELPQKNTLYMSLYLFMLADLIFEIWFIERDILNYEEKIQSKRNMVRIISSIFNVLMYGTFGLNIFKFFKELNMSYMALPVAIVGLFNSFIWLLYGIVNSDDDENNKFYLYTNIFGISFCTIQIILFFLFKDKKTEPKFSKENLISDKESSKSQKKKKKKKKGKTQDKEEDDILTII